MSLWSKYLNTCETRLNSKFLFFIFLFLISKINCGQPYTIEKPFYVVTAKRLLITPIFIGNQKKEINLVIDIGSEYSWFSQEIFSQKDSQTFFLDPDDVVLSFENNDGQYKGILSYDSIYLDSKNNHPSISEFPFLSVKELSENSNYKGALSLANQYKSKYNSFVFGMFPNLNSFSLQFKSPFEGVIKYNTSIVYIKENEENVPSCNAHMYDIKWGCELTHVVLGDYENVIALNNTYSAFETVNYKIYVPMYFFNFWVKNAYDERKKGSSQKECFTGFDQKSKEHYFQCPENEIQYLKEISLVFDSEIILHLRNSMMYYTYNKNKIMHIVGKDDLDHFIIGGTFLSQFETVFDFKGKTISFVVQYEKNRTSMVDPSYISLKSTDTQHKIVYFIIVISIIGVCILLGQKYGNFSKQIVKSHRKNMKNIH